MQTLVEEVYNYAGYPIFLSDKPEKKYFALVTSKKSGRPMKIYFGDTSYEQYHDKIGYYSHLDHGDPVRRANYKARHENNRHIKGSAGYFSDRLLW